MSDVLGTWEERMAARHAVRQADARERWVDERIRRHIASKCWCEPLDPRDEGKPPDHVCEHGYRPEDNTSDIGWMEGWSHCLCCHAWFPVWGSGPTKCEACGGGNPMVNLPAEPYEDWGSGGYEIVEVDDDWLTDSHPPPSVEYIIRFDDTGDDQS